MKNNKPVLTPNDTIATIIHALSQLEKHYEYHLKDQKRDRTLDNMFIGQLQTNKEIKAEISRLENNLSAVKHAQKRISDSVVLNNADILFS